jgi:UDP-N-acetylmuramate dehydrogenase
VTAPDSLEPNVPLAPLTTLGVGGRARWYVRATSAATIADAHRRSEAEGIPLLVVGGGSNLVVSDEGWHGLVLHIALAGVEVAPTDRGARLHAAAGEPWDGVVSTAVERNLSGIECLSGIPGTAGGTPIQNVGAYGQDVAAVLESVEAFDRRTARVETLTAEDCGFAYRSSRFKREDTGRFIVCALTLRLSGETPRPEYPDVVAWLDRAGVAVPRLADVRRAVLAVRRGKGMVLDPGDADTRSVGSFFMNPVMTPDDHERISAVAGIAAPRYEMPAGRVKVPAAWLIERAGFRKGDAEGGAAISSKHTLAVVNRQGASSGDVVRLAARIKRGVHDRFGVMLQPEPVFVGFESDTDVEYLRHVDTAD